MKSTTAGHCDKIAILLFIAALLAGQRVLAVERASDTVIYQSAGLTIRPAASSALKYWCEYVKSGRVKPVTVNVVYDVAHDQREQRIGSSVEKFAGDIVYPAIATACAGPVPMVRLIMKSETEFPDRMWDVFELKRTNDGERIELTNYNPNEARQHWSAAKLESMKPGKTMPDRSGAPLFADDAISIYPRDESWCTSGIEVVYDVPHAERDAWLAQNYGDFAAKVVQPLLQEKCRVLSGKVYFYRKGEADHWDSIRYEMPGPMDVRWGETPTLRATNHSLGRQAQALVEKQESRAWSEGCSGPFCDLPGGLYLHAIYAGDAKLVRKLDRQANQALHEQIDSAASQLEQDMGGSLPFDLRGMLKSNSFFSPLAVLADTYMYDYSRERSAQCLDSGAVTRTMRYTTDKYELYSLYGAYQGTEGGREISATYTVNQEFAPLCDRLCNHLGGGGRRWAAGSMGNKATGLTLDGLDRLQNEANCASPEVQQFERNLIEMTSHYLDGKSQWLGD